MKHGIARALISLSLVSAVAAADARTPPAPQGKASATVYGDRPAPTYDRRIFTQFAEHLGNGI